MRFVLVCIAAFFSLISCTQKPEYPNIPQITFNSIQRYTVFDDFTQTYLDSINITINFQDGDGDLGLSDKDIQSPYQPYTFIFDKQGNYILYGASDTLPHYDDCHYVKGEFTSSHPGEDTVLIKPNLDYFNYFADLYIKENGRYEKVDFSGICPAPLYGRFPVLNPDNYEGPIDGHLTFTINDPGLRFILEGKTARFRIYIQDRALHKSNTIETTDITFSY